MKAENCLPLNCAEVADALLGRYSQVSFLAKGGQAVLFKALEASSSRGPFPLSVVLKFYCGDRFRLRTLWEVTALCSVKAKTLIELNDFGWCKLRGVSRPYLTTRFIPGYSLLEIMGYGPQPVHIAAQIAHDIALAIDELSHCGLVHRDIKPDNIMITHQNRAVLLDLGLTGPGLLSAQTTLGKIWGTKGYMSPEQMAGNCELTCKSDIFALGIVLQESLLGYHPTGYDQTALQSGGLRTCDILPTLESEFASLIDSMLCLDTAHRPTPMEVVVNTRSLLLTKQAF